MRIKARKGINSVRVERIGDLGKPVPVRRTWSLEIYSMLMNLPGRVPSSSKTEHKKNTDGTFQVEVFYMDGAMTMAAAAYIRMWIKQTEEPD